MAGKATWEYRGCTGRPASLVQFSNGSIQTPEDIAFTLYENKESVSRKTKKQRILTAQTDRLSYVGKNFSPEALKHSSLCRYFVGVLNKETGKMEVYDAEQFCMQPVLKNGTEAAPESQDTTDHPSRTYREKVDALIEAFGTNKQKRALMSRKLNHVGSEMISKEMSKAAEGIIESKGTEMVQEVVDKNEVSSFSLFLPPCNAGADKRDDVYKLSLLIPPVDYASLKMVAAPFTNISPEEIRERTEKKQHSTYVLRELYEIKNAADIDQQACILWYLDILIKLCQLRTVKRKDLTALGCPNNISNTLMKAFSVPTFKHERVQNLIPYTMQCKVVSYALALALHASDFEVNLTLLQRDLKISEKRMLDIAKAMGLKINKKMIFSSLSLSEIHRTGSLDLPVVINKPMREKRKRNIL